MGIFGNVFKGTEKEEKKVNLNWITLTDLSQLEEIKKESKNFPVFIFKHSTRCGISRMVIKQFEGLFQENHTNIKVYYLDLLNYREISNEIAAQFEVQHQSPQLIILKNKTVVEHTSHYDITQVNLDKYIS